MNDTPNLILPYILAAQSQKHVTHNEAIRALDALVQITALDRNLAAPPGSPAEGDRYIVAASPTGAWAGHAGKIAAYQDAAWLFYAPKEGWLAWVADENLAVVYDGTDWISLSAGGGGGGVTDHGLLTGLSDDDHTQYHNNARGDARYTPLNPATLGINATADTTNRLTLASAASLFNHAGTGGHQVKINKALAADTASFLFQTAFSGRAELGTTSDDDFHFKVSANGTVFNEAILIDRTTGACTFPNTSFPSGETNTASNVGTAGVGVFKQKTGVNLEFKKVNAGSAKVSITDDTANNELDVDVVEASLTLANLGGSIDLSGAKASGVLAAARFPALTGDVTSTAGALGTTIAANAVANTKLAGMATATLKGRTTAGTGDPEDLTVAQAKTLLNLTGTNSGDQTSIAGITGTIAQFNTACTDADFATGGGSATGTNTADVTLAGAPNYLTLAGQVITRALVDLAAHITGRLPFTNLTQGSARSVLGVTGNAAADAASIQGTADQVLRVDTAGTGLAFGTVATAGIANSAVTPAKMADVATATVFYRKTAATGAPEVQTLATLKTDLNLTGTNSGDQTITLTGPVTGTGAGSFATTITDNNVTMAKLEDAPAFTLLMRNAATTGDPGYSKISSLTDRLAFGAGDKLMIEESTGELRKIDFSDLPGSAGGISNGYATVTDGTTPASAVGADTFKLRAGSGLAVAVQNNDATHGDNALFALDLRRAPVMRTDFSIAATGIQGDFIVTAISTGTVGVAPAAGVVDGNHPGVMLIRSSTTANSGVYVVGGIGAALDRFRIAGGEQFDLIFRTPAALTNLTYRLGVLDTVTSADAVDGIYFEMPASGAIVGKTSNNSVRTTSATIATLVANTWYHARLVVNAGATAVDFFIFSDAGTQLGTVNSTTNIPTASGRECGPGGVFTNSAATSVDVVNLDYMAFSVPGRKLVRGALT